MLSSVLKKNEIKLSSLNTLKLPSSINKAVSFKSEDKFVSTSHIKEENFAKGISDESKKQIKDGINQIISNNNVMIVGLGADGNVYKLPNISGYSDGIAVKISHQRDKSSMTGEMQRVGADFKDEIEILKSTIDLGQNSQKYVGDFKLDDGRNVLVTTFVNGKNPKIENGKINQESLTSLLDALYKLDEKNILHRDLKMENIIVNDRNDAGIIDYGASIRFDVRNFDENVNVNNFPPFEVPTNLRNFEDTFLSPYINEMKKSTPSEEVKEFFCNYLKIKSIFHSKKSKSLIFQASDKNIDNLDKEKLLRMADYEKTLSEVFKNPDDDTVEIELLKNNITYNSELAYKNEILLLNPLANYTLKMNALISAKRLEKLTNIKLKRPNSLEKRKYLQSRNEEAKFRLQKIAGWTIGLTNWLCECLTTDIDNAPDYMKVIIDQVTDDKDLTDFEIPNI